MEQKLDNLGWLLLLLFLFVVVRARCCGCLWSLSGCIRPSRAAPLTGRLCASASSVQVRLCCIIYLMKFADGHEQKGQCVAAARGGGVACPLRARVLARSPVRAPPRYADNIQKTFAVGISIVLNCLVSGCSKGPCAS